MPNTSPPPPAHRDHEGFLVNLTDWTLHTAKLIAIEEGITLNDRHWEIIYLLRKYYEEFDSSPAMRPLLKYVSMNLAPEKAKSVYLLSLFPGSPAKLAAKIAGLPKPANCL